MQGIVDELQLLIFRITPVTWFKELLIGVSR